MFVSIKVGSGSKIHCANDSYLVGGQLNALCGCSISSKMIRRTSRTRRVNQQVDCVNCLTALDREKSKLESSKLAAEDDSPCPDTKLQYAVAGLAQLTGWAKKRVDMFIAEFTDAPNEELVGLERVYSDFNWQLFMMCN